MQRVERLLIAEGAEITTQFQSAQKLLYSSIEHESYSKVAESTELLNTMREHKGYCTVTESTEVLVEYQ